MVDGRALISVAARSKRVGEEPDFGNCCSVSDEDEVMSEQEER